jgi:hypothetical protein
VPTAHLKRLAGRLDAAMPGQNRREVLRFGAVAERLCRTNVVETLLSRTDLRGRTSRRF